jgi:hypothetical protein
VSPREPHIQPSMEKPEPEYINSAPFSFHLAPEAARTRTHCEMEIRPQKLGECRAIFFPPVRRTYIIITNLNRRSRDRDRDKLRRSLSKRPKVNAQK